MTAVRVSGTTSVAATARAVMEAEADAIALAARRLDQRFDRAVNLLLAQGGGGGGKVIVTGVGKSGHVARKLAATLCATGTPALFLHPTEAAHGDLGAYAPGDPTIMISKSGTTPELFRLFPRLDALQSPTIGILGNLTGPLAERVAVVLDARVSREADPLAIVPTSSTAVAAALGDALAVALMRARGFTDGDFAARHPAGQLKRNLTLTVADVMHGRDAMALVAVEHALRDVVIAMTEHPLGAACVVDPVGKLLGIITDGDLRRTLMQHDDIRPLAAADVMTPNPVTVLPRALLRDAANLMEDRPSQISVLPVVDGGHRLVGLVRIHDVYAVQEE